MNEFDQLWDEVARDYLAIVMRDRAYLEWRDEQNPTPYIILTTRDACGRLRAYGIGLVIQSGAGRIGYLVDLLS